MTSADATRAEPPPALGRSRHSITVSAYFRMGEAGVLGTDAPESRQRSMPAL
jgi:hypothetical protein